MKISTILDHIDSGHMVLPEFQRGYVWNRGQVRGLFNSLYRRHPVGGLLVWATAIMEETVRGDGPLAAGSVKLLLDGQQRMTSLYGVARGKPPAFFDGNSDILNGLRFHLEKETFEFHKPVMGDDPLWIDVTELMNNGQDGHENLMSRLSEHVETPAILARYSSRVSRILGILEIDLHVDEVTGEGMTLDVVVDIFNRVNSGGTTLSKGDLALAKICAEWPEGREAMKAKLEEWTRAGFYFTLDWLLRSVNAVLTGEAKFQHLHDQGADEIKGALNRAVQHIDTCLNLIGGRLGLDHDRVFFGRFGIPVMVRYLDQRKIKNLGSMDEKERDKLLFWFAQAAMWGRFSGSTETVIDQDLEAIDQENGSLDPLLEQLRLWSRGFLAEAGNFAGWSLRARFYPVLYMLTRMGESKDWGTGLPLKANLLGQGSSLEKHHIFPKAQLYKAKHHVFKQQDVNALANFCFLTRDTNLMITDRLPAEYFPEIEAAHPGALASQWIPDDPNLWKLDNFHDFIKARQKLLAEELNRRMEELLHGDIQWILGEAGRRDEPTAVSGGVESGDEDAKLEALNDWMDSNGLPRGEMPFDLVEEESGQQLAMLDIAWPNGVQQELSQPVAIMLGEETATIARASQAGFRCFTDTESFRQYVEREILGSLLSSE